MGTADTQMFVLQRTRKAWALSKSRFSCINEMTIDRNPRPAGFLLTARRSTAHTPYVVHKNPHMILSLTNHLFFLTQAPLKILVMSPTYGETPLTYTGMIKARSIMAFLIPDFFLTVLTLNFVSPIHFGITSLFFSS